jgi:hypothetical protein
MQQAAGQGRMATVELPVADVEQRLAAYRDQLTIAAINSPTSTVISGEAGALADLLESLAQRGVYHHMLPVNYAFQPDGSARNGAGAGRAAPRLTAIPSSHSTDCRGDCVFDGVLGAQYACAGAVRGGDRPATRGLRYL